LFIGGLNWATTEEDLKNAFENYWETVFIRVIKDKETWYSRWFGFVEFSDIENAKAARDALNGKELGGRVVKVDFAQERPFTKK
jgi:RNA recognition motif-containing protein